jgi:hypothetical protein
MDCGDNFRKVRLSGGSGFLCLFMVLTGLTACQIESPLLEGDDLDFDLFVCSVQPILEKECSMPACHGNSQRPFQVLASGRMRIQDEYESAKSALTGADVASGKHPKLTYGELAFNYYQARAFAQVTQGFSRSQLITRPLALRTGGMAHAPRADVYFDPEDPRIQRVEAWISGATIQDCP